MSTRAEHLAEPDTGSGSTRARRAMQLRLLDPGPAERTVRAMPRRTPTRPTNRRGPRPAATAARRADWLLDAHTRRVGREGVAAAREVLRRKAPPERRAGHAA